jgi:hypothetical protein
VEFFCVIITEIADVLVDVLRFRVRVICGHMRSPHPAASFPNCVTSGQWSVVSGQ